MKKVVLFLSMALCLAACGGDDDEPMVNPTNSEIESIWKSLNGAYKATYYISNTDNIWYTETIDFHPYEKTKRIIPIYEDKCDAYGTADITDTRFFSIVGVEHYYYSIVVKYQGAQPYISFYKYDENGNITNKEDRRIIADITPASFRMWGYGLTEENNTHTYNKE